jgi:hypothetical protein
MSKLTVKELKAIVDIAIDLNVEQVVRNNGRDGKESYTDVSISLKKLARGEIIVVIV